MSNGEMPKKVSDTSVGRGEIEIPEQDVQRLSNEVESRLSRDLRSSARIHALMKTENTFRNSLGDLYEYLQDLDECQQCGGTLSTCAKRRTGYRLVPTYDEDRDQVRLLSQPCPLQLELEESLSHIDPWMMAGGEIYRHALALQDLVHDEPDRRDVVQAFRHVLKVFDDFRHGLPIRGFLFTSLKPTSYPLDLLAFSCYLFARQKISCSFVSLSFLADVTSANYDTRRLALLDHQAICRVPALFLMDVDVLPNTFRPEVATALEQLIDSRRAEGKVTFATSTQRKPSSALRLALRGRDGASSRADALEEMMTPIVLRDF